MIDGVPRHWTVAQLRRYARFVTSGSRGWAEYYSDEGSLFVRIGNLTRNSISLDLSDVQRVNPPDGAEGKRTRVHEGDLLFSITAYLGSVAVAEEEAVGGYINQHIALVRLDTSKLLPRFTAYFILSSIGQTQIAGLGYGGTKIQLGLEDVKSLWLAVPTVSEQRAIADFLDREAARIDTLVGNFWRSIKLLNEEVTSLVLSSMNSAGSREMRLGNAAEVLLRPVTQREGELYTPVGLFNRGRGLFHKDPRGMDEMGDSNFFWIGEGDLIISGQFAWEGAIFLAGNEDSGCVVSHRYHVLRGKDGTALTEYLFALLSTKYGDFLLNENSRGAAGRNRPLNIDYLLKESVSIPDLQAQAKVAKAVHLRNRLFREISKQVRLLQEYRSALISVAVTGQIDVRTYRPQEAAAVCP